MATLLLITAFVLVALGWILFNAQKRPPELERGTLAGPGTFEVEVVGESHYQKALEKLCGGRTEDSAEKKCQATLVLEDSNPYDSNAVRIDVDGATVGYLPRDTAKVYRQRLKEAGHPQLLGTCDAVIRGGWDRGNGDKGSFGIRLDLPTS
ncbi:MAG: hypothetical protein KGO02_17520 [Alphaproteobacteria bacterium]|nr:hypothetical protein [Alphaproteobacteria bacterium]